jgi:hypothetical protein
MIDDEAKEEIVPSELDELTHAELRLLYQGCQDNIRFAKSIQWRTVGSTLIVFVLMVAACHFLNKDEFFVKTITGLSFAFSAGAIYALSIYQSWQATEREKVRTILKRFSSAAREVHRIKSQIEANIHRYILFAFMAIAILIANYLTVVLLMKLYPR